MLQNFYIVFQGHILKVKVTLYVTTNLLICGYLSNKRGDIDQTLSNVKTRGSPYVKYLTEFWRGPVLVVLTPKKFT